MPIAKGLGAFHDQDATHTYIYIYIYVIWVLQSTRFCSFVFPFKHPDKGFQCQDLALDVVGLDRDDTRAVEFMYPVLLFTLA